MSGASSVLGIATVAGLLCGCNAGVGGPECPSTGPSDDGPGDTVVFAERDYVCEPGAVRPCRTWCGSHVAAARSAVPGDELDDATFTFVIDRLSLPEPAAGRAAGFNLDGMDSGEGWMAWNANCEEANWDWVSLFDDQNGVDNALGGLVPTMDSVLDPVECPGGTTDGCIDATLARQVSDGSVILLVEVSGVESLRYDAHIQVQLFRASIPGTGPCATDADCAGASERCAAGACRPPPATTGGRLAAGQRFEALEAFGEPVAGDIFAGRVRASPRRLTIPFHGGGLSLSLRIASARMRFHIAASGLTHGQIGGVVPPEDIVGALSALEPLFFEESIRDLVSVLADIHPSAADPYTCELISVGLTFEATTADRI